MIKLHFSNYQIFAANSSLTYQHLKQKTLSELYLTFVITHQSINTAKCIQEIKQVKKQYTQKDVHIFPN